MPQIMPGWTYIFQQDLVNPAGAIATSPDEKTETWYLKTTAPVFDKKNDMTLKFQGATIPAPGDPKFPFKPSEYTISVHTVT